MNELELRQAANDATRRIGQDRIDFIMQSYPNAREYWADIEYMAERIDEWTNNIRESEV